MTLYSNKQELLRILDSHHLKAKKHLGQNFLINTSILKTIVEEANLNSEDYILEVGPGLGILTEEIANVAKRIDSIELDLELIKHLKQTFSRFSNINFINQDALKTTLPKIPYKLIANIPYYITSPLLNHFLFPKTPDSLKPTLIVLLVQKEVAEKICAKEGDQSILSLQVQIFGHPKIVRKVPANSFYPIPKVDSAILKIETYPQPLISNPELFFKIIKMAFSQKRKTLLNSLQSGLQLPKILISQFLKKTEIDENRRPQSLKITEWEKLLNNLYF